MVKTDESVTDLEPEEVESSARAEMVDDQQTVGRPRGEAKLPVRDGEAKFPLKRRCVECLDPPQVKLGRKGEDEYCG